MSTVCFVPTTILCLWMIASWAVWWSMRSLPLAWCTSNLACHSRLCLRQRLLLVLLHQLLLLLVCVVLLLGEAWLGRLSRGWVIRGLSSGIGPAAKLLRKHWRVVLAQRPFVARLRHTNSRVLGVARLRWRLPVIHANWGLRCWTVW